MAKSNPFKEPGNIINLIGIIVGIIFVLLVPKAYATVVGMSVIFLCAALILWHLPWVEIALLASGCAWAGYAIWPVEQRPVPELHGLLIPANEPTPQNWCAGIISGPRVVMNVRLGALGLVTPKSHTSISLGGEEVFAITRATGGIKISARVIDVSNQVVAQISENELYVNPSSRFQLSRPDWHSLIIVDEKNKRRVLDVYFASPNFVRVYGRFFAPGGAPLIVEEGFTQIGSNIFQGRGVQCLAVDVAGKQSIDLGDTVLVVE